MAEWSCFFNSFEHDRRYTAAEFAEYFSSLIGNGIFQGGNNLKVNEYRNMDISVGTGKAFINGYYYVNKEAPKTLTLSNSHVTLPRIDKVVLRLNLSQSERLITATIKEGTPSSNPTPPELQRNNAIWELGLADIRVNASTTHITQSNITDLRLSSDFCGIVTGFLEQPDLNSVFNQYSSKFGEITNFWDNWFNQTSSSYYGWFNQSKAELYSYVSTDFDDWSRRSGYQLTTTFAADGSIAEIIKNINNNSLFATRLTEFLSNGRIKETISFAEPPLTATKLTTFSATDIICTYS